jgi:ankyrin repeat protein
MGRTPMFHLLTHLDATTELVRRFDRLGGTLRVTDNDGYSPLHLLKWTEIAQLLLNSGASPASKNKYGNTPLHLASMCGRHEVAALLLDLDTDIGGRDESGRFAFSAVPDAESS